MTLDAEWNCDVYIDWCERWDAAEDVEGGAEVRRREG